MRHRLNCDPDYAHISLYRGSHVRLVRKKPDVIYPYTFVTSLGKGKSDPYTSALYAKLLGYIEHFSAYSIYSFRDDVAFREELYTLWQKTQHQISKIGLTQILESAPNQLIKENGKVTFDDAVKYIQKTMPPPGAEYPTPNTVDYGIVGDRQNLLNFYDKLVNYNKQLESGEGKKPAP